MMTMIQRFDQDRKKILDRVHEARRRRRRRNLITWLFIFFLGVAAGYAWRMIQIAG